MSDLSSIEEYLVEEDWDYLEEEIEEDYLYDDDDIPELMDDEEEKQGIGNFFSLMFTIIGGLFFFFLISIEILESYRTDWWTSLSWAFLGMFFGAVIGFIVDSLLFVVSKKDYKKSLS